MNSQFLVKLLQHLRAKKADKGFTLIELLVVVIIVGILAAVALPNLLGQIGKGREVEGKNGVGTINRAQQSYHYEARSFVTSGIDVSDTTNPLGVAIDSKYYNFTFPSNSTNAATTYTTAINGTDDGVRNYAAGITYDSGKYYTTVCQTTAKDGDASSITDLSTPAAPTCGTGATQLD